MMVMLAGRAECSGQGCCAWEKTGGRAVLPEGRLAAGLVLAGEKRPGWGRRQLHLALTALSAKTSTAMVFNH